jgi:FKBP-type peptidyl-prolyl cis-trans isomerase FklB
MKAGQALKTEDGFVIKALTDGEGPLCPEGATARVHYTGKLLDGRVFDSSVTRGIPFEFTVGG